LPGVFIELASPKTILPTSWNPPELVIPASAPNVTELGYTVIPVLLWVALVASVAVSAYVVLAHT
jgi:hypothetical protein